MRSGVGGSTRRAMHTTPHQRALSSVSRPWRLMCSCSVPPDVFSMAMHRKEVQMNTCRGDTRQPRSLVQAMQTSTQDAHAADVHTHWQAQASWQHTSSLQVGRHGLHALLTVIVILSTYS